MIKQFNIRPVNYSNTTDVLTLLTFPCSREQCLYDWVKQVDVWNSFYVFSVWFGKANMVFDEFEFILMCLFMFWFWVVPHHEFRSYKICFVCLKCWILFIWVEFLSSLLNVWIRKSACSSSISLLLWSLYVVAHIQSDYLFHGSKRSHNIYQ